MISFIANIQYMFDNVRKTCEHDEKSVLKCIFFCLSIIKSVSKSMYKTASFSELFLQKYLDTCCTAYQV